MKLKLDEKGNVILSDGKPVYLADDGKEVAFDYAATLATISRLNGEARSHRESREAAEAKLKSFEGIEDAEQARKALGMMANLDAKKLIDAGEAEKVKLGAVKSVEEKYRPIVEERDALKQSLVKEKIGGSFSRSKYIGEKLAIPADLVEARFGSSFSIEHDKVVAKDASGNLIYSRSKPGEFADFDEALERLVSQYPNREHILKGSGASGGGASGTSGTSGGKRTMTRAQFDALAVNERAAAAKESTIID